MDIQYNRNEEYKTIVVPNQTKDSNQNFNDTNDQTSTSNSSSNTTNSTNTTILLNDDKYVETTVLFLPNIWSLMPNTIDYQKLVDAYKNYIDNPSPEVELPRSAVPVDQSVNSNNNNNNTTSSTSTNSKSSDTSKEVTINETNVDHVDHDKEDQLAHTETNFDEDQEEDAALSGSSLSSKSLKAHFYNLYIFFV